MQDDGGRQGGWYAIGTAFTVAGCALFPLGLTMTPRSQAFQFLGLVLFVFGLVIIFGAMTGRRRRDASRSRGRRAPNTRFAIIAASLLVIVVGGSVIFGVEPHQAAQGTQLSPMLSEQHLVGLLIAGDNYTRLQQIIGAQPDLQKTFKSGTTLYQFNRSWEYIDLLVKDGRVLSVGVYAKSARFKPVLNASGFLITVNGSPIARQIRYSGAIGAVGNCGQSDIGSSFFEGFALPMAEQQSSFILGWVDLGSMPIPQSACAAGFFAKGLHPAKCDKLDDFEQLSSGFLDCLNSSRVGQEIRKLSPAVAIVTAPYQRVLPEMFDYGPLTKGAGLTPPVTATTTDYANDFP
jgi:hypothetical protein